MIVDKKKIYISFLDEIKKLLKERVNEIEPDECIKIICDQFPFKIKTDELYNIYMEKLDVILEQYKEISTIEPIMMVGLVCSILDENKDLVIK